MSELGLRQREPFPWFTFRTFAGVLVVAIAPAFGIQYSIAASADAPLVAYASAILFAAGYVGFVMEMVWSNALIAQNDNTALASTGAMTFQQPTAKRLLFVAALLAVAPQVFLWTHKSPGLLVPLSALFGFLLFGGLRTLLGSPAPIEIDQCGIRWTGQWAEKLYWRDISDIYLIKVGDVPAIVVAFFKPMNIKIREKTLFSYVPTRLDSGRIALTITGFGGLISLKVMEKVMRNRIAALNLEGGSQN